MDYRRMPIEVESPEAFGYENIDCNLSESSVTDLRLGDLGLDLNNLLLFYGDHRGKPELRELIAADLQLKSDDVLITSGAALALFILSTTMLKKGDHLVVAKTNYATNIETPRAIGADISYLELKFEEGFRLDIGKLEALITPKTKFVSLTYPHNPTGVMISGDELSALVAMIEKKGTYLLIDETYREMVFGPKLPVAATLSDRVISISSMSKAFGLPGIRIGWMICKNPKLMEFFLAAKEQITITNSVIDEEIAFQYLKKKSVLFPPVQASIARNFEILKSFMNNQQILEWVVPQGGCVCFPRIKVDVPVDVKKFHDILLNQYKTYVGRGHWFEADPRFMRIGYSWDKPEKLQKGLSNIIQAISQSVR